MNKILLAVIMFFLMTNAALALTYCDDANNKGCWGMEDSVTENDLSSNFEDLSVGGGGTIPQDSDRKFGSYSRDFELDDGDFLWAANGGSTDISGVDQEISYTAWVKPESLADGAGFDWHYIVSKNDITTNENQYAMFILSSQSKKQVNCSISYDGGTNTIAYHDYFGEDSPPLAVGTWMNITCVYNDIDLRLYVNGVLVSTMAHTSGIYNSTSLFRVGAIDFNGITFFFDGLIDEVAVFDRELSVEEVLDIKNNGLLSAGISAVFKYDGTLKLNGTLRVGS